MKKQLVTLLLSVILAFSIMPTLAFADGEAETSTAVVEVYDSNGNLQTSSDKLDLTLTNTYTHGYTFKLLQDIDIELSYLNLGSIAMSYGILMGASTLDLNGHTITFNDNDQGGYIVCGVYITAENTDFSPEIKNGTMVINFTKPEYGNDFTYAMVVESDTNVSFENLGIVVSGDNSIDGAVLEWAYADEGTITFENSIVYTGSSASFVDAQPFDTEVVSGTYSSLSGSNKTGSGDNKSISLADDSIKIYESSTETGSTSKSALDDVDGTVIVSSGTDMIIVADPPGATAAPEVEAQSISLMSGGSGGKVAYTYDSVAAASEALGSGTVSNADGTGVGVYTVNHGNNGDNDGTNILLTQAETVDVGGNTYFVADKIEVEFEETSDANVYNINLVGADGTAIYRFLAAQLEFELTSNDAIGYEIAAADGISMTESGGVYEFNLTADNADEIVENGSNAGITAASITIGTVTFTGVGTFDFGVKAADDGEEDDTNKVQTAVYSSEDNNIVRTYVPSDTATTDVLDVSNGLDDITISLEKSNLTVNVVFPNAVSDQSTDYTQMSVKITGLGQDGMPIALGATDSTGTDTEQKATGIAIGYTENGEETGSSLSDYNGYHLTDIEVYRGYSYQLEFTGDGYRTHRTTIVPIGEDASVTVWNNVMDSDMVVISQDDADSAVYKTTTFLAGDICMNGEIDLYDLSAVVSYFGKTELTADETEYIQYDLNRDNKIDSKDIAMVLVSWGK